MGEDRIEKLSQRRTAKRPAAIPTEQSPSVPNPPVASANAVVPPSYLCGPTTARGIVDVASLIEEIGGFEDDGYLKLCPADEGKAWYCVWRWRWGQWRGHYVLARVDRGALVEGLLLLREKVAQVKAGYKVPARDKFDT